MYPATTQMRYINIEVPPELFEHYQAMEKRSYQYKIVYARISFINLFTSTSDIKPS